MKTDKARPELIRSLAITAARLFPESFKRWIHRHRRLSHLSSKAFATVAQAGGRVAVIKSGPLEGVKLIVSEHTSHAHLSGTYEINTQLAIDRYIKTGGICYDLGASIGYLSLLMARKAKHVYAFEPAPHAIREIRNHLEVNQFTNVTIIDRPVSDHEYDVQFALNDNAYGNEIVRGQTNWPTISLTTTTLDEFAKQEPMPDFIKIDVEGEEARVLKGADRILSEKKPVILCELHGQEVARHVHEILIGHGYSIKTVDGRELQLDSPIIPGEVQIIANPIG